MLYNEYETTSNSSANLVACAVSHYRKIQMPLKAIDLHPALYGLWELWVSQHLTEEEFETNREKGFQFDGVDVRKASAVQTTNLSFEFYGQE